MSETTGNRMISRHVTDKRLLARLPDGSRVRRESHARFYERLAVKFRRLTQPHCCGTNRQGRFQVVRLTVKKRMRATLTAIRATLLRRRHEPVPEVGKWLNRVVQGYFNYHAVPSNLGRLEGFRSEVCRTWRRALFRRSQRHRLPWEHFTKLVHRYVPHCQKLHPYPDERFHTSRH
jgi:hypothetical protein